MNPPKVDLVMDSPNSNIRNIFDIIICENQVFEKPVYPTEETGKLIVRKTGFSCEKQQINSGRREGERGKQGNDRFVK